MSTHLRAERRPIAEDQVTAAHAAKPAASSLSIVAMVAYHVFGAASWLARLLAGPGVGGSGPSARSPGAFGMLVYNPHRGD